MKNLCVYCGSNPGNRPDYIEQARALARELIKRDIGLVYGGSVVGIMGEVANEVLAGGGRVIGVIPELLLKKEHAHRGLTELHLVQTMHERKAMMIDKADGFIALPGGAGTLEEFFEVWTWAQLNMHESPAACSTWPATTTPCSGSWTMPWPNPSSAPAPRHAGGRAGPRRAAGPLRRLPGAGCLEVVRTGQGRLRRPDQAVPPSPTWRPTQ